MSIDAELDPQEMADRAWNRARSFEFRGKPLQVWDFLRKTAAIELGMRYGKVSPDELEEVLAVDEKGKPRKVVTYRGVYRDATIVLWLMHQDAAAARQARARPIPAHDLIDQWAEEQRLFSDSMEFDQEAMTLFETLMADDAASAGVPQTEQATGGDSKKKSRSKPVGELRGDGGNRKRRGSGKG